MKKRYLFLILLLIMSILVACTPETTNPDNDKNQSDTTKKEPVVTKTIPEDFPIDKVPLYELEKVEGVITVGENYHVYYFSNKDKKEIFDYYKDFFKDEDIVPYENEFAYELRGELDDSTMKLHIIPSSEEDYKTTVILFLFKKEG